MNTKRKTKKTSLPPKAADETLAILILLIFKHLAETDVLPFDDASCLFHDLACELPSVSNNAVRRINQIDSILFQLAV